MFQNQLVAVLRDTAFARILDGKISAEYAQDVGPQVVAKVATKRYEKATMAHEAEWFSSMTQLMFSLDLSFVRSVFNLP